MRTLLVVDIDKTICDSRKLDKYLPEILRRENMQAWFDHVDKSKLPVVTGAKEGLQKLRETYQPVKILVLTARNDIVYNATVEWLDRHFPDLEVRKGKQASLSMKRPDDHLPSIQSKAIRLERYKKLYEVDRVVVVDDDPEAAKLAQGPNDIFINIKNCNWNQE